MRSGQTMKTSNTTESHKNSMDDRIYVPNNKDLCEQILVEHHELAALGHPGQKKMLELLKRTYWWPRMKLDMENFV